MTNEERDLIARFIGRVAGAQQSGNFLPGSSSVPQSQPLPPIDREADAFIAQQFEQNPEARYRITQMAIVQEAALAEMNNRIQRLQWELEQARHAIQSQPQQSAQQKGFFSSLFGGGAPQPPPQRSGPWGGGAGGGGGGYGGQQYQPTSAPPQPQYPPQYQPGMFQQRGSGFLGSALTTAAGVAGGMVVGNALMNAFSGHQGGTGGFGSNTSGGVFDSGGVVPTSDPTAGFASDTGYGGGGADPFAQGGDTKGFDNTGFSQNTGFDQGGFDQGGGGFDQGGGGFDPGGGGGGFDSGGFDSGSDNT
jgi:hypothetical protein